MRLHNIPYCLLLCVFYYILKLWLLSLRTYTYDRCILKKGVEINLHAFFLQ